MPPRNFGRHALVFMVWSVLACHPDSPTGVLDVPAASASLESQADRYWLTYLEVPAPFAGGKALDVSRNGTTVGWVYGSGSAPLPARWTRTALEVLPHPEPPAPNGEYATSISPDGTLITGGSTQGILLWKDGALENLGLPPGAEMCYDIRSSYYRPPQVNEAGQVLANCPADSPGGGMVDAAFLHDATGWTRIGSPDRAVYAYDLGEDGSVVGYWDDYGIGEWGTFVWNAGQLTGLDDLWPTAVNDRGQMIVTRSSRSYLWTKGNLEEIPQGIRVRPSIGSFGSLSNDGTALGWFGLWDGAATVLLPTGSPTPCRASGFSGPKWIAGWCGNYPPFKPVLWTTK